MNINTTIVKKILLRFEGYFGWMLCALLLKSFLIAVKPFVFLHFTATIVNDLFGKINEQKIMFHTFGALLCIMIIEIGGHLASRYVALITQRVSYNQSLELANKAMQINYQLLESPQIQSLIEGIKQSKFQRGDVFTKEIQFIENFVVAIFSIATSAFYAVQFAKEKFDSGASVGSFCILLIGFGLLLLIVMIVTVQNNKKHNETIFKRFTEVASINRMYGFYRKNIFQNYKYGKEIRIFDEGDLIQEEFNKILRDTGNFLQNIGKQEASFRLKNSILNTCLSGIAYMYIGMNAYNRVISIGSIVKYSGAITQLFTGIIQMVSAVADLKGNEKFLQQYFDCIELEILSEKKDKVPKSKFVEITFENVYFKYQNDTKWILENINFHISNREHIALVGRNGSGKTTCIRLLLRLYKPDKGRILLNGIDIQQYSDKEYWKLISVVFQDFKIFSFSLEQNIVGTNPKNEQKFMDVMQNIGINQAVERMYAGKKSSLYKDYDEEGILISGGEAQKLAIARALYKDAPIFVLDEPSAALDPISECELYEKISVLLKEKTMIFISHRLSSCCFCDRILVLKEGKLVEVGSHEELLCQNGEYQKLWDAQASLHKMLSYVNPYR